jgi:hypothetical protein
MDITLLPHTPFKLTTLSLSFMLRYYDQDDVTDKEKISDHVTLLDALR